MGLDVYLTGPEEEHECTCTCGHVHTTKGHAHLFNAGITHNLTGMARAVGIYKELWRQEETDIGVAAALSKLNVSQVVISGKDGRCNNQVDQISLVVAEAERLAGCHEGPKHRPYTVMELLLYHGRKDPTQDMEENGFWYPVIPGVSHVVVTYLNMWRIVFKSEDVKNLVQQATGWESRDETVLLATLHDDLIVARNSEGETCYFGDWEIAEDGAYANHPAGYLVREVKRPSVGDPHMLAGYVLCEVFDSACNVMHRERIHPGYDTDGIERAKTVVKGRCEAWLAGFSALQARVQQTLKS